MNPVTTNRCLLPRTAVVSWLMLTLPSMKGAWMVCERRIGKKKPPDRETELRETWIGAPFPDDFRCIYGIIESQGDRSAAVQPRRGRWVAAMGLPCRHYMTALRTSDGFQPKGVTGAKAGPVSFGH